MFFMLNGLIGICGIFRSGILCKIMLLEIRLDDNFQGIRSCLGSFELIQFNADKGIILLNK